MATKSKVIIVGAGVVGVACAEALYRTGYDVTVIEQLAKPASNTSKANGGQLCSEFCLPFNAPKFWIKLLKELGKSTGTGANIVDAIKNYDWAIKFLANSKKQSYLKNSMELLNSAYQAQTDFQELLNRYDLNFEHKSACGKLYLYKDPEPLQSWSQLFDLRRSIGLEIDIMDKSDCIKKEPLLANAKIDFYGGIYAKNASVGNCELFTQLLSNQLDSMGVKFLFNVQINELIHKNGNVSGVKTKDGDELTSDVVILASGMGINNLLPNKISKKYPIAPLKGYSLTIPINEGGPNGTITDGSRAVALSTLGNHLRVSGGVFLDSSKDANQKEINRILSLAKLYIPTIDDNDSADLQPWAGLRPTTPSCLPYIDKTDLAGLYINAGHGSFGWTLAANSANKMLRVLDGKTI